MENIIRTLADKNLSEASPAPPRVRGLVAEERGRAKTRQREAKQASALRQPLPNQAPSAPRGIETC